MGRENKAASIAELKERLVGAQSAVLTDFRGLSVADLTELRTLLRKSAVEYRVVKNTLARIAVRDTALAGLGPYLEGPTGIAISTKDPVVASKILSTWGKGKPTFAPHLDGGDGVVVINSEQVVLTGKKLTQKFDFRYSGYPGGQTLTPYSILMKTKPEKAFTMAVKGMLPPNKLRDKVIKRLKVFKGADIPSEFKNAEKLEIRG